MRYESQNIIKKLSIIYWNEWPWEWFVNVSLKNEHYERVLKRFRMDLQTKERIQVAYMGIYLSFPQPHIHLLMLGQNKERKCLADVDPDHWEQECGRITHRSAVIEKIYDQEGVLSYMFERNTPVNHHEEITPYNKKLLKRTKIERKDQGNGY